MFAKVGLLAWISLWPDSGSTIRNVKDGFPAGMKRCNCAGQCGTLVQIQHVVIPFAYYFNRMTRIDRRESIPISTSHVNVQIGVTRLHILLRQSTIRGASSGLNDMEEMSAGKAMRASARSFVQVSGQRSLTRYPLWVPPLVPMAQLDALATPEGRSETSTTSPGSTSKSTDAMILFHCWPTFRAIVTSARRSLVPTGSAPAPPTGCNF